MIVYTLLCSLVYLCLMYNLSPRSIAATVSWKFVSTQFFFNFTRQCLPLLESLKSVKSILGSGLNIYKPWLEKQSTATHFQRCFIANLPQFYSRSISSQKHYFYYKNFATCKLKIRKKNQYICCNSVNTLQETVDLCLNRRRENSFFSAV